MAENLGQVASVFVGGSAPSNTNLIWRDTSTTPYTWKSYNTSNSAWEIFVSGSVVLTWVAGAYSKNQRVKYYNLDLRATAAFTSSNVENEIVSGKWEVVGGVFSITTLSVGEVFVVPPNTVAISHDLVMSGGDLKVLSGGILRAYGSISQTGGSITGEERIKVKPL